MEKARHLRIKKGNFDKVCAAALAGGMMLSVLSPTAFAMDYNIEDGTVHVAESEDSILSWQDDHEQYNSFDSAYNHTEENDNEINITDENTENDPTSDQIIEVGDNVTGIEVNIENVTVEGTTDAAIEIGDNVDIDLTLKDTSIEHAENDGINIGDGSNVDITFEGENLFSGTGAAHNTSGIQVGASNDEGEDSTVTITGEGDNARFTVENASNGIYIGKNDSVTIDGGNPEGEGNLDIVINGTTGTTAPDSTTSDRAIINYGDLTVTGGASVEIDGGNIGINTQVTDDTDEDSGFVKITGEGTNVSISNVSGQHGTGIYMESYDADRTAELEISDGAEVSIDNAQQKGIVGDNTTVTVDDAKLDISGGKYGITVTTRENASNSADLTITDGAEVSIEGTTAAGIYAESYNADFATDVTVADSTLNLNPTSGHGIQNHNANVTITGSNTEVNATGGGYGISFTTTADKYYTTLNISDGAKVIVQNTQYSGIYSENGKQYMPNPTNKNLNQIVIDNAEVKIDGTSQGISTTNTDITINKSKVTILNANMLGISIGTADDKNDAAKLTISDSEVSMQSSGWGGIYTENFNLSKASQITINENSVVNIDKNGQSGINGCNTDIAVDDATLKIENGDIEIATALPKYGDTEYGNTIKILNKAQVNIENKGKGISMAALGTNKNDIIVDGAVLNIKDATTAIAASSTDVTLKGSAVVSLEDITETGVELSTSEISENELRIYDNAKLTIKGEGDAASGIDLAQDKSAYIYGGADVEISGMPKAVLTKGDDLIVEDASLISNDGVIDLANDTVHFEIRNKSKVVADAVWNTADKAAGTPEFVIIGGTMTLTGKDVNSGLNSNHSQVLPYEEEDNAYLIWPTNGAAYGNEKLVNFVLKADSDHCTIKTYGWGEDGAIPYSAIKDFLGVSYEDWYLCDLAKEDGTLSVWVPAVVLNYYYKDQLPEDTDIEKMTKEEVVALLGGSPFEGKDAIIRGESINFATLNGAYTSHNTETDKKWYYFDENDKITPFNADTKIIAQSFENIYALDTVKPEPEPPYVPGDPSDPVVPIIPVISVTPETPEEPEIIEIVTETPSQPEEAAPQVKLPQTGQSWALAGLLAAAGTFLTALGIAPKRRKDKHEA